MTVAHKMEYLPFMGGYIIMYNTLLGGNPMFDDIFYFICAAVIIILLLKIISLPVKLIFKLLINTACGIVILFVIDVLSVYTGIWIEPTIPAAAITGILGLPGVALLLIGQWVL